MSDLVTFPRDRLNDDEETARRAAPGDQVGARWTPRVCKDCTPDFECTLTREENHIARHDPPRVLADVAAKRAILAEVESWQHTVNRDAWHWCPMAPETRAEFPDDIEDRCTCGRDKRAHGILAPLAAVYADHPDYREEWKP